MKLKDFFDIDGTLNEASRTASLRLRLFGIDFELSAMGYLDDMVFPFMFLPSLRGFAFQTLFVGLFIGRYQDEVLYPSSRNMEEEEW